MLIFQNQHVPQLLYLKFLKVKLFVSTKYWDNQYYSDQFYNLQQLNFFSLQVLVLPLKIFSINLQGFFWVIFIATLLIFIVFSFIFIFFTFLSFQLQLPLVFFILVKLTLLYRNQNLFIQEFLQIFLQILPLPKLENQSIIINHRYNHLVLLNHYHHQNHPLVTFILSPFYLFLYAYSFFFKLFLLQIKK